MRNRSVMLSFRILCVMVAVSLFSVASVSGAVVNDLMAHWTFDDTANPLSDSSGNGHHLTFSGDAGAPYSTETPTGTGQSYSPTNYGVKAVTTFADAPSMTNYSISYWINADAPNSSWNVIGVNGNWGVYNSHSYNDGKVYVGQNTGTRVAVSGLYDTGAWTQFTYTYDKGKAKVYKNGEMVVEYTDASNAGSGAWNSFEIGQSDVDNIHGKLDDFSIWSSTLSANSVKLLASKTVTTAQLVTMTNPTVNALVNGVISTSNPKDGYAAAVLQDDPIAYWRMNEGASATEFTDATGYGHNMGSFVNVTPGAGINISGNTCAEFAPSRPSASVQFDPEGNFDLKEGFSVEYWLNPDSFADNVELTSNSGDGWVTGFVMHTLGNVGKFYVGQSVGARLTQSDGQADPLNVGEWNHVVYTFDGATGSLYFDGDLVASKALAQNQDWNELYLCNIDGLLSDLAIYDHALSADMVAAHYASAFEVAGVPEPASWAMLLLGLLGLSAIGVRKSGKKEIKA